MLVIIRNSGSKAVFKKYESFQIYRDKEKQCHVCRVIDNSGCPLYFDNVVHVEVLENGEKHEFL